MAGSSIGRLPGSGLAGPKPTNFWSCTAIRASRHQLITAFSPATSTVGRRNLRRQPTTLGRLSDEWIRAVLDSWRIDNFNAESTIFHLINELY